MIEEIEKKEEDDTIMSMINKSNEFWLKNIRV